MLNAGVNPSGSAITQDGRYLYVANNNNYGIPNQDSVSVFDLKKNILIKTIYHSSFNEPYTITIDDDRKIAYVTNSNTPVIAGEMGVITKISTQTHQVVGSIESLNLDGPSGMVINKKYGFVNNYGGPGGVKSGNGNSISIINLHTDRVIRTFSCPLAPAAMTISKNRLYVISYVNGEKGTGVLSVYDISNKHEILIKHMTGLFGPFGIVASPNSNMVYVTNFGSNNFAPFGTTISFIDTDKIEIVKEIHVGIQPSGIAITKDGRLLIATCYNTLYSDPVNYTGLTAGNGSAYLINLKSNKNKYSIVTTGLSPSNVVISPDDKKCYISNYTGNTISLISLT